MERLIEKASVLMESLPYIRRFYKKTFVIKYGGHAMIDKELKESFVLDVIMLQYIGLNPIIVHGGGPQIDRVLSRMGIESIFIDGMRVTDARTMEVVEMVLVGSVNKEIVGLINMKGGVAVGLSGQDGKLVVAKKMKMLKTGDIGELKDQGDLGMVGEVEQVNPEIILELQKKNFIPVIAPVGIDNNGQVFNINADLVAGKIASAIKAEKLILLTDTEGIKDKNGNLISTMNEEDTRRFLNDGTITGGMIPKVQCCLDALDEGVNKTHIVDGRMKHAILLEIFTDKGIGTEIIRESRQIT